jgi:RHS repeat-associated protein
MHAQYLYDVAGQRVKKLVRRQGGQVEVTHYIDAAFEHHRWGGMPASESNLVHVTDGQQRIALIRIGPAHPDDRSPAVAIQLGDHLGSSVVVLDDTGAFIKREEFTPYGETSFGSYARKRYRFTGQERDEESSLAYHSARYYLPWVARWSSCDPKGAASGVNQYQMCGGDPVNRTDTSGADWKFTWRPWEWQPWEFTKEEVAPRVEGGLKAAGGAAAFAGGWALCESGLGCVIGGSIMGFGADVAGSGVSQVWHGSPQPTVTGALLGPSAQELEENFVASAGLVNLASQGYAMWKTGRPLGGWSNPVTTGPGAVSRAGTSAQAAVRGAMTGGSPIKINPRSISAPSLTRLTRAIENRMLALGIPNANIGIPWEAGGRGFDPAGGQIGGNVRTCGINTDAGIFEPWNSAAYGAPYPAWDLARLSAKVDATIAHEWGEFGGLTHNQSVAAGAATPLPITDAARQLLKSMPLKP